MNKKFVLRPHWHFVAPVFLYWARPGRKFRGKRYVRRKDSDSGKEALNRRARD